MRASADGYQSTTQQGVGLHTLLPVVVRRVKFVAAERGTQVRVTASIGELDTHGEDVTFQMSYREALAADIIDSLPVVVRRVRFPKKPRGPQVVEVTATIGESEDNTEAIRFHLGYADALAADIIECVEYGMDEREFVTELALMLEAGGAEQGPLDPEQVTGVASFEDVGMLTGNAGLVVTLKDGSEFQLTVVQSREARG